MVVQGDVNATIVIRGRFRHGTDINHRMIVKCV